MRTTATCPKCSSKKLLVADLQAHFYNAGSMGQENCPIPAIAVKVATKGFLGSHQEPRAVGRFESWICAVCGYTEFYAKNLGNVDELAAQCPGQLRIVDSTRTSKGPFR